MKIEDVPDWLIRKFEAGHFPRDSPPGLTEYAYMAWKAAGGGVREQPKSVRGQPVTRERVERLMVSAGRAINANGGRCGLVESVLCSVTAICCDLLSEMDDREKGETK